MTRKTPSRFLAVVWKFYYAALLLVRYRNEEFNLRVSWSLIVVAQVSGWKLVTADKDESENLTERLMTLSFLIKVNLLQRLIITMFAKPNPRLVSGHSLYKW